MGSAGSCAAGSGLAAEPEAPPDGMEAAPPELPPAPAELPATCVSPSAMPGALETGPPEAGVVPSGSVELSLEPAGAAVPLGDALGAAPFAADMPLDSSFPPSGVTSLLGRLSMLQPK